MTNNKNIRNAQEMQLAALQDFDLHWIKALREKNCTESEIKLARILYQGAYASGYVEGVRDGMHHVADNIGKKSDGGK